MTTKGYKKKFELETLAHQKMSKQDCLHKNQRSMRICRPKPLLGDAWNECINCSVTLLFQNL
jgi:hypothetical protein